MERASLPSPPAPLGASPAPRRTRRGWWWRLALGGALGLAVAAASGWILLAGRRPETGRARPPAPAPGTGAAVPSRSKVQTLHPQPPPDAERLKRARAGVVVLETAGAGGKRVLGTGVIVDARRGLVATCWHVTRDATEAVARLRDGQSFAVVGYAALDPARDLALLQIKLPTSAPLAAATLAHEPASPGADVLAVGHPEEDEFAAGLGRLTRVTPGTELPDAARAFVRELGAEAEAVAWLEHTIRLRPGASGGPLFNAAGEVIGLNAWVDDQAGRGYALPAALLAPLLAERRTDILPLEAGASPAARQASRRWRASAGQVETLLVRARGLRWHPTQAEDYDVLQQLAWAVTLARDPELLEESGTLEGSLEAFAKAADKVVADLRQERWNDAGQLLLLNEFAAPQLSQPRAGVMFIGTVRGYAELGPRGAGAVLQVAGFEAFAAVTLADRLDRPELGAQCLVVGVNDAGRIARVDVNGEPRAAPVLVCRLLLPLERK